MEYETICPGGHRLRVTEAHFGREIECPTCKAPFVVPDLSAEGTASNLPQVDASDSSGRAATSLGGLDLNRFALVWGRPMMAVGLILVLVSRGCDTVGSRAVGRVQAKAQMARKQWEDSRETERLKHEAQRDRIRNKKEQSDADKKRIEEIEKQLADLAEERNKQRQELTVGKWRDLQIAAQNAASKNQIRRYWREIFFVFATILLGVGLVAVSWTAQGAERMVCLIMLAILTFSIYVGGIAWIQIPTPRIPGGL